jgi:DNA-binding MarR family transcriptional regulator
VVSEATEEFSFDAAAEAMASEAESAQSPAIRELALELTRFGRALHLFKSQVGDLLPTGLDPAAAQLLAWLVKQGPSRQGELAECAFLDPSTVSRRISQLVRHGLVERRADQVDGRAIRLHPTVRGQQLYEAIVARRERMLAEVLAGWSGPDLAALRLLLHHFNNDFETHRVTGHPMSPSPSDTG